MGQGQHIFAERLARFAAQAGDERIAALATRVGAPVTVAVHGRKGVGRGTVADALRATGVTVAALAADADVDVFVIAEVIKPEECAAVTATTRPAVVVLNKADLCGFAGGPISVAKARAHSYRRLTGAPTVPMVAHLAVASVDADLLAALDGLAQAPADLRSVDRFVRGEHRVSRALRERLLEALDIYGVAHAVLAVRTHGAGAAAALPALLRRLSQVDVVAGPIAAAGAEASYRRVCSAIGELEQLAVGDERVAAFLSGDDLVGACMSAAVDLVQAAGLVVEGGDDASSHLRRAVRWCNYSRGPVSLMHRRCGSDIARGSLRLLQACGGVDT